MKKYADLLKRARSSYHAIKQRAMRGFVSDTLRRMEARDMSRVELANALGASPAYVTKILRGDVNFTLESMAKIAHAVGGRLRVSIVDNDIADSRGYSSAASAAPSAAVHAPPVYIRLVYSRDKPLAEFSGHVAQRAASYHVQNVPQTVRAEKAQCAIGGM